MCCLCCNCCCSGFYLSIHHQLITRIMKKNMGTTDRVIRLILAAIFAFLYIGGMVTGTVGLILVVLGAVFALTSLVSFCPLYTLVGFSTCPTKQ